jgi:DNA polymerase-3 subunit epsilon
MNTSMPDRHSQAADFLSMHPGYRVQRRLVPVTHFHEAGPLASSRISSSANAVSSISSRSSRAL